MIPSNELIRTEKHALKVTRQTHADLHRTVLQYRRLVRVLAGIVFVHFPELSKAPSKCFAVERLFHATKAHRNPRYAMVDRMFWKFPSYLRRAAIEAAFGAVSSFVSNYARWQSGIRTKRESRPPALAKLLEVNPPLYAGGSFRCAADWSSVHIKVLEASGHWGWTPALPVRGRLKRLPAQGALSPSLIITGRHALLACPVQFKKPRIAPGDVLCAVDLGINTGAVCAIVDSAGTVRGRRFIATARHNDRLDKLAHQMRRKTRASVGPSRPREGADKAGKPPRVLGQGFCKGMHRRMQGLNRHIAQALANAIVAFAQEHGAQSLVFEHLKGFRPKAGSRAGTRLRQRFHRWMHRLLVAKATFKAQEAGLRVAYVYPRGTSAWAYDGSGEVRRDKHNHAVCTFASGKRYNADLNAALNIAARFIAQMLGVTTGDRPASEPGKSSGTESRMPIVLADIWRHAGAPV